MAEAHYDPALFAPPDLETARRICLSVPSEYDFEEYWARSTRVLGELLIEHLGLSADSIVVDYGAGVGRVARYLIETTGCKVVGVDFSPKMREFATAYVSSPHYFPCSRLQFRDDPVVAGRCTAAYAVFSLQHCLDPADDIGLIDRACVPRAPVAVVNSVYRWVPTRRGWATDTVNVRDLCRRHFADEREVALPADYLLDPAKGLQGNEGQHYCAVYRTRERAGS